MKYITRIFDTIIILLVANSVLFISEHKNQWIIWTAMLFFLIINVFPSLHNRKLRKRSLRIEGDGCELLIVFCFSVVIGVAYLIWKAFGILTTQPAIWLANLLVYVLVEAVVFWNGIIRVYLTSVQLGMKHRIIGIVCGWIVIVHLVVLYHIIHLCTKEVIFENQKLLTDEKRKEEQLCKTKYPILLVHGVFFRDFRYFNYWGRIPEALEKNGATIFYGNHQSAASVEESGRELATRIQEIIEQTGCEKVNVIAHSKGGLDMRYAISGCGAAASVATLTTINTPHRGCVFADYLLTKIPEKTKNLVANQYNAALRKLGDFKPDFLAAVLDLTASSCEQFNAKIKDEEGIYYQSVGSKLNYGSGGRFPLNFSYQLVKYFDGFNDGLVSESSFIWGQRNQFLTVKGKRGISHGDMIDLNRENIDEFDVREYYVNLVSDLKKQGY